MAPIRVARLPNTTSHAAQPVSRLASTQPTVRPGTAATVKTGRIVSASERRTWIAPLARPSRFASQVSTTYRAAIIPALASCRVLFLFISVSIL